VLPYVDALWTLCRLSSRAETLHAPCSQLHHTHGSCGKSFVLYA
jgi:hypothetical protein